MWVCVLLRAVTKRMTVAMVMVHTHCPTHGSAMLAEATSMKLQCRLTNTVFYEAVHAYWGQLVCTTAGRGSESSKHCSTHNIGSVISGGHLWQL